MSTIERPQLRPYLAAAPDQQDPRHMLVWDRLGFTNGPRRLTVEEFRWLQHFDGQRTLRDLQILAMSQNGGALVPLDRFVALVQKLDEALFLDGPRFRQRLRDPVREPSCIGCYKANPDDLRRQLKGLFTHRQGPGMPSQRIPDGSLRAALIPHIDYHRGGVSFAWGFKEVVERTNASLFVIIGTSHFSTHRFTLTRKHFKTPLGVAATDQDYIDKLVKHYGEGLFDDEIAHLPEHSIELEVVFLQFLYEGRRPIRIVPLVVGSFQDCVDEERRPGDQGDIRRMVVALRKVEEETAEPICYLISGDLAHIGPKFGDPKPVRERDLVHSKEQDHALLRELAKPDCGGYFGIIAREGDRRRICGMPPTLTVLDAFRPGRGQVLHYDQYVHPLGFESVSFASVAFYR